MVIVPQFMGYYLKGEIMVALRQVRLLSAAMFAVIVMTASVFAQTGQQDELKTAVREATDRLNSRIPKGNKIVILNVQSGSDDISEYVISELVENTINDGFYTVVDRQQLDAIQSEQQFQMSGAVDDKSALEIGKFLGAQTIISGAVRSIGEGYRLSIRALDVQTAQVQAQFNRDITASKILSSLLGGGNAAIPQQQQTIPIQQTKTKYEIYEASDGKSRSLKKRISLEAGGAFSPYGISYGDRTIDGIGGGGYLRADFIYVEIVADEMGVYDFKDLSGVAGVLGKYPVGNDFIKVFPLLGFGFMTNGWGGFGAFIGGRIDVGITEIIYLRSEYLYCSLFQSTVDVDYGMSLKIGGGLDIGLGERKEVYIRPELMYNLGLDDYVTGHHIDLKVGIGYKWGGQKRVKEQ